MGGHGGDHIPKVPSPDKFKVEDVPELKRLQEYLASKGLKDPWLRNEVWRFQYKEPVAWKRNLKLCTTGLKVGIPAFLITIAIEKYFGIDYGRGHHNSHGSGH
ncbi:NADH dehydrogenase [ubiquinone] 1 beta subcomplex subunit 3 [Calliopsis andreniformis]|uniref:NADH dehydrogenase [ubiquinone] 1 beta subcomplex subunit 3 n=1 Tax=Calliopsis andreniformis TaxID=337506 RepID=UPI003FCE913E